MVAFYVDVCRVYSIRSCMEAEPVPEMGAPCRGRGPSSIPWSSAELLLYFFRGNKPLAPTNNMFLVSTRVTHVTV